MIPGALFVNFKSAQKVIQINGHGYTLQQATKQVTETWEKLCFVKMELFILELVLVDDAATTGG